MKDDFSYSSTYLRTIEKHLLSQTDIDRMIGARDAKEALKVLENTNYAKEFKESISETPPEDYRKILKADLQKGRETLHFLTNNKLLIEFVSLFFDIYNIKLFFKEKFFKRDMQEFISRHGSQNSEELKREVKGERANIDRDFKEIIGEASEKFKSDQNPSRVDSFLDRKMWELSLDLAERMENEFLINLLKKKIDLLNLKSVLRRTYFKHSGELKEWLIKDGNISVDVFLERVGKTANVSEILSSLKPIFSKEIQEEIDSFLKEKEISIEENLSRLFKKLGDIDIENLKESKFVLEGPEVIACYFLAKFNANRNVRIILEGKIRKVGNEEILERVRIPF